MCSLPPICLALTVKTADRCRSPQGTATRAAIGDREGRVDFKTRVDVVKDEERKILEERAEAAAQAAAEAAAQEKQQAEAAAQAAQAAQERLVDAAPAAPVDIAEPLREPAPAEGELTSRDVSEIEGALETLATTRRRPLLEHEELEDIKEELADYQEVGYGWRRSLVTGH